MLAVHAHREPCDRYRVEASWRLANWRSLDRFLNEPETGSVEGMESSPRFENLIGEIVRSIHCGEMGSVASALRRTREDVLRRLVTISTEFGTYVSFVHSSSAVYRIESVCQSVTEFVFWFSSVLDSADLWLVGGLGTSGATSTCYSCTCSATLSTSCS